MSVNTSNGNESWVRRWVRYGPVLERIAQDELRRFRYEEHVHVIDSLLAVGSQSSIPRTTSGLVEQQRLFQKAR